MHSHITTHHSSLTTHHHHAPPRPPAHARRPVLCLPIGMFCLEVAAVAGPRPRAHRERFARSSPDSPCSSRPTTKQAVIARTLQTLLPTVPPACRVLVVADNCTDDTAAIARQRGAEAHRADRRRPPRQRLCPRLRHSVISPKTRRTPSCSSTPIAASRPDTVRLLGAAAIASGGPCKDSTCATPIRAAACCSRLRPRLPLQEPRPHARPRRASPGCAT